MRKLLLLLTVCGLIGAHAAQYDFQETFDFPYHNSFVNGGTIAQGYTPALQSTKSLRIVKGTGAETYLLTYEYAKPPIAATMNLSTAWHYIMFRPVSLSAGPTILQFRDTSANILAKVVLNDTGTMTVHCGSASASTTDALSTATTYHLWFRYTKGTGADAVASVGFSTDGTRPTGGNKFQEVTTGTSTSNVARVAFGYLEGGVGTPEGIWDRQLIRDTTIGDNP